MEKYERVKTILLCNDDSGATWKFLPPPGGRPLGKKAANKFLLGCVMDYQIRADIVWKNARRLSEDILGDPGDLWTEILRAGSGSIERIFEGPPALHRFPRTVSRRVLRIALYVADIHGGDARKIWAGRSLSETRRRLRAMRAGDRVSDMIIGTLVDRGQIKGESSLRADPHVRRVLGRVFLADAASAQEATEIAEAMMPGESWILDGPLYRLSQDVCKRQSPECDRCALHDECLYLARRPIGNVDQKICGFTA